MEFETELRDFEGPEYQLGETDKSAVRPEITKIVAEAKKKKTVADLESTSAEIQDKKTKTVASIKASDKRIKAATGRDLGLSKGLNKPDLKPSDIETKTRTVDAALTDAKAENTDLKKDRDKEKAGDEAKLADEKFIKENYDKLLKTKGQAAALQELIQSVKSPEVRARLQSILNMVGKLQTALPVKSAIVTRYLNQSKLNLGSGSMVEAFAPFIDQIDAATDLTDEDKETIHKALHHHPNNSRDAKSAILQGRGIETDPKTGKITKLPYDKNHPLELEGGGKMYSDNGALVVAVGDGWKYRIEGAIFPGDLTRIVSFGKDRQEFRAAGIEKFMDFEFGIHKPEKHLKKFQDIKNTLLGGSRGLEGTYASHADTDRYMHIIRFISSFGESPVKVNENTMAKSMKGLGIAPRGVLDVDMAVLKEIGAYFQESPTAHGEGAYEDLRQRLIGKGLIQDTKPE